MRVLIWVTDQSISRERRGDDRYRYISGGCWNCSCIVAKWHRGDQEFICDTCRAVPSPRKLTTLTVWLKIRRTIEP